MQNISEPEVKTSDSDLLENSDSVSADAVRRELEKILASRLFRSAPSQREFLRYTVEESVAGRGHLLKEYLIGLEAFNRGEDFDPRLDPIVRTQARKLRTRLATYYETEGADDPVRVEFRTGSYAPAFHNSDAPAVVSFQAPGPSDVGATDIPAMDGPAMDGPAMDVPAPISAAPSRRLAVIVLAILAVIGAGVAIYLRQSRTPEGVSSSALTSIAVLPFTNLNQDTDDEFLSDGLTEELIDSLRRVPGLQVMARTSAFRFKAKAPGVREIGSALHVGTVLVGSVRRTGSRMRVTVQLISTANNDHLWSGSYDRDASEANSVRNEISQAVVNALGAGLHRSSDPNLLKLLHSGNAPNSAGYANYLKGLYFWNKLTADGINTAIQYFQQAIADDPSFARAYAALADCYVMEPLVASVPPVDVISKITAAASRALELDGSAGEPHFDLAVAAEYQFDWAAADKEFQKGLALSPGNVVGHIWYGHYLSLVDRREEALVERRAAAELDPASPYTANAVGNCFSRMGRYGDAVKQFQYALTLEPDFGLSHQSLGTVYLMQNRYAEAIGEFQQARKSLGGPRRTALLAYAYAISGRKAEAREILAALLAKDQSGPFPALPIAQIYMGLGDRDQAFLWLEKAIDQKDIDLNLDWDSIYAPLRSDARFAKLRQRMKLA